MTLVEGLCHCIVKRNKDVQLNANDCQVGCGLHVGHLVVHTLTIRRELLFGLGLEVSPEEEDLYLCAREVLVNEAEVEAGEAVLAREASEQEKLPDNNESDTDSELSEAEIVSSDEDMGEAVTSTKRMSIKAKQQPTVADKLHAIVVDVLRTQSIINFILNVVCPSGETQLWQRLSGAFFFEMLSHSGLTHCLTGYEARKEQQLFGSKPSYTLIPKGGNF
ncbi:hypothetical protein BC835DRAFT_1305754 [Cytidiella melzeri]|nr:hypothetical protein BC835DRAFT_1305754 [Cytidiella melzeri]